MVARGSQGHRGHVAQAVPLEPPQGVRRQGQERRALEHGRVPAKVVLGDGGARECTGASWVGPPLGHVGYRGP